MFVATSALFSTTLPAAVSLAVEPLSLLLMPGLFVALATAGSHDIEPNVILRISAIFYFLFFCIVLLRRPRAHKSSR